MSDTRKKTEAGHSATSAVSWDDVQSELFTPEEIVASKARVAILSALIDARNEKKLSQRELEQLSGIKQPMIARIENGTSMPRLDTLLRLLLPLGKTIAVVPIDSAE